MSHRSDPIITTCHFQKPIEVVWAAITEHHLMIQWYFEQIESFVPEIGFETQFNVQVEDRNYLHLWKILDVNPPQMISYTWNFAEYPGDGQVVFELESEGSGTKLTHTALGLDSFPDDVPEFTRASCKAGWNYFLNERLRSFLAK
jgi:uncharacterized protein YndB with AHSA1/START domain